jgi:hypothetical protein
MFKYNKSSEVKLHRNKNIRKWHKLFLSFGKLFQEATKRKALASLESRMGGKRERGKERAIVYPLAAETRGSNATSLHHPNSFKLHGNGS